MPIAFKRLNNAGKGHFGQALGSVGVGTYYVTAVELEFRVSSEDRKQYKNLKIRQFAGPDVVWKKVGSPLESAWTLVGRNTLGANQGDDPLTSSLFTTPDLMGYYDIPGPNMVKYLGQPISRLYVAQLFTGWIEGTPSRGGATERLCPVVAWHSRVNLANANWQSPRNTPKWYWIQPQGSGLGWIKTEDPPVI